MKIRRRELVVGGTALGGWAAFGLPRPAWAASAAQTAVDAAKEFSGTRDHHYLGGGAAVARPAQLLHAQVEGADRHLGQGDRVAGGRDVHQDPAGAPGRFRRLRRAERDPVLDAGSGPRRRARGSRSLRRQVRLPRGAAGDRTGLPRQPDDRRRQDLRPARRWRRLRPLLSHRRSGRSGDPGGLQDQVRHRPAGAAQDLEGVRSGRLLDHRGHRRQALRRRLLPRFRLWPVPVPGALPQQWRQVLRCRDDEGDDQRPGRRRGVQRLAGREQVDAAGRADLGLRREPGRLPRRATRR